MEECSICLEPLTQETSNCSLPGCSHTFHVACMLNTVQYDTRCPICRNEIPNVLNKNEDHESTIISLETIYNDYQRKRRNYLNKRRRVIKQNKYVDKLNAKLKSESRQLKETQKNLDKCWNDKSRKLWSEDDELLNFRKSIEKQRNKCLRMDKKIQEYLKDLVGPSPEFEDDLDSLIRIIR